MLVFNHQAPRAITSRRRRRRGSTARDRPSALSYYTQSRSTTNRVHDSKARRTKTTEQNRIVRTGKSEAKVTSNKKLRLRYCTVEANYWQTRSIACPVCDSKATCHVFMISYLHSVVACTLAVQFFHSSLSIVLRQTSKDAPDCRPLYHITWRKWKQASKASVSEK